MIAVQDPDERVEATATQVGPIDGGDFSTTPAHPVQRGRVGEIDARRGVARVPIGDIDQVGFSIINAFPDFSAM
jgi:hypothetical protein